MVGDTDNDMNAGRAAGVKTAFVTWGYMERTEIDPANIDMTISSPAELVSIVKGPGADERRLM
jgi:phosphoglycolate phosphatase-like HAD superfamily hydrolase